tara:strand:- start:10 stop:552 length:543 start_codon:yes stop_codon:yes gene_type:complete
MHTRIIVGSNEWTKMKRMSDEVKKFPASKIEYSAGVIPVSWVTVNSEKQSTFKALQREMMNNGWEGVVDDDNEMYFTHPQYPNKVFNKFTYVSPDGNKYMLPIVNRDDDIKGLGCSIVPCKNVINCTVESNKWHNYFDTRQGKRREKYYEYLNAREEKKREIEEEEKKAQKTKQALSSNL